jgi:hypothetical protein
MMMLLLQTTPAHSESRQGRERGRSIPFASFRCCAAALRDEALETHMAGGAEEIGADLALEDCLLNHKISRCDQRTRDI